MAVRALLVGINAYQAAPLRGCVNDVTRMRELLTGALRVPAKRVRALTDAQATKAAMVDGLRWLAEREKSERQPVRLFHFSGHGVQIPDTSGDEEDATDEALAPYDYDWDNLDSFVTDDLLGQLYAAMGSDAHIVAVMDCCHSGTNQRDLANDIAYRSLAPVGDEAVQINRQVLAARKRNLQRIDAAAEQQVRELWQRDPQGTESRFDQLLAAAKARARQELFGKQDVPGNIVLLAACQDRQTAADAKLGGNYQGALTHYLTTTLIGAGGQLPYTKLFEQLASSLSNDPALNHPGHERQIPQLECDSSYANLLFLRDSI